MTSIASATISNPSTLHDPTVFGYSHVAEVPAGASTVLVAGQYASGADGAVIRQTFAEQVELSFVNLRLALDSVGCSLSDVVQIRTFIVDHDEGKLHVLGEQIHRIWADQPPTQTLLGVAALALPGMMFEVDAVAVRPRS